MQIQIKEGLSEVLALLEQLDPFKAVNSLGLLFISDINNQEYSFTGKCCNLWCEYLKKIMKIEDPLNKGDCLLMDWKNFTGYLSRQQFIYDPVVYAIQKGVFTKALNCFLSSTEETDFSIKAQTFRKIGICYKHLGEYENAWRYLSDANKFHGGQSDIIADLADCFALTGNERNAKVLFREAFYIDPVKIDLDFLLSELIRCLIDELSEKKFPNQDVLSCWIPVYGTLWGIFNIKRELGSKDLGALKKEIFALENENKNPSSNSQIIVPRLINCYFWLADYYISKNENNSQVSEIKLKIKILDTSIYEQYVK